MSVLEAGAEITGAALRDVENPSPEQSSSREQRACFDFDDRPGAPNCRPGQSCPPGAKRSQVDSLFK